MAANSATTRQRVARIGGLTRDRSPDDPELRAERQALAYEQLAKQAAKVVADWPKPTPEQLQAIAAILRAGAA